MIEIIPAIDLIDGKCVRLSQGNYAQKTIYNENPLEVAKNFEAAGIQRLHLVDLDGAKQKRIVNHKVLEQITSRTNLYVDFGGGIQSDEMAKMAFDFGAKQITAGSVAVRNPAMVISWLQQFGSEKVILGADAHHGKIAISGWQESTELSVYDFVNQWLSHGVKYCISTDVAKDGMLAGPSFDLYTKMQKQNPNLNVIASGGVSQLADIEQLNKQKLYGVIVGKALYEGRISLKQITDFIKKQ
jgi:phosphoribosylformimino-5-aminoimidazole carboxamide ribotide isomerase